LALVFDQRVHERFVAILAQAHRVKNVRLAAAQIAVDEMLADIAGVGEVQVFDGGRRQYGAQKLGGVRRLPEDEAKQVVVWLLGHGVMVCPDLGVASTDGEQ
jgi:hypothetical protein